VTVQFSSEFEKTVCYYCHYCYLRCMAQNLSRVTSTSICMWRSNWTAT